MSQAPSASANDDANDASDANDAARWAGSSVRATADGTASSWEITPAPDRIVAIGDLHGDVEAFGAILCATGLLDPTSRWSGGAAHLVLVGDLVGGARGSRLLLNAVMRLEEEARAAGGRVHALLGNHDVLPADGHVAKMTRSERALYAAHEVPGADGARPSVAFRGDAVYARWLRARSTLLKIGDTVFVHAGLDRWVFDMDPDAINENVRAWIAHRQGVGPKPRKKSRWTIDERGQGPLWVRTFKVRGKGRGRGPSRKVLRAILAELRAARVVVGHSPTADGRIALEHPRYGEAVVMIDTRISDPKRGRLGALIVEAGALRAAYAPSRRAGSALAAFEEAALEAPANAVTPAPASAATSPIPTSSLVPARDAGWFTGWVAPLRAWWTRASRRSERDESDDGG